MRGSSVEVLDSQMERVVVCRRDQKREGLQRRGCVYPAQNSYHGGVRRLSGRSSKREGETAGGKPPRQKSRQHSPPQQQPPPPPNPGNRPRETPPRPRGGPPPKNLVVLLGGFVRRNPPGSDPPHRVPAASFCCDFMRGFRW